MAFRNTSRVLLAALLIAVLMPASGSAYPADFFDDEVSGNATYEAMVIQPQAIYDPAVDATYVIYQGAGLDPYAITFDHATSSWNSPVRIGDNPLGPAEDLHGCPAVIIDGSGYLHVFYGAHGGYIQHSRSTLPHDASSWKNEGGVRSGSSYVRGTYPQPFIRQDGSLQLFFRYTQYLYYPGTDIRYGGEYHSTWGSVIATAPDDPLDVKWGTYEPIIYGEADDTTNTPGVAWIETPSYYASFSQGASDTIHVAFLHQEWDYYKPAWPYTWGKKSWRRHDLFYGSIDTSGVLRDIDGTALPEVRDHLGRNDSAKVIESGDAFLNQVVVRDDGEGRPVIIYLTGDGPNPDWSFARWTGSAWTTSTVATTDHLFDAGDISVTSSQTIDLYLSRGLETSLTAGLDASRGGNMERWSTDDGGASWVLDTTIATSPGPDERLNNPQVVRAGSAEGLRIAFSEWNNDAASFVHKAYLWGEPGAWSTSGYVQRVFTPDVERVAGTDRIRTAVEASQETYAFGADTVLIANLTAFPDALCGGPLATALDAPILLTRPDALPGEVSSEIARLGADHAIIVGGTGVVTDDVRDDLRDLGLTVGRLSGSNRYATSRAVAERLVQEVGSVGNAVIASGETFPDALCVSPVAARQEWPIILTGKSGVTTDTVSAYQALGIDAAVFVGGDGAITPGARAELIARAGIDPSMITRLEGSDRYETAYEVGLFSLDHGLGLERFVVATGSDFADALTGGVLAEAKNGIMVITRPHELSSWSSALLSDGGAWNVRRAYIMGGAGAIEPTAENQLAAFLLGRQDPNP